MTVVLVQLSDLHLRSSRDPIVGRSAQIAAAIASAAIDPSFCILAFSGDLAFSGTESQYVACEKFIATIQSELARRMPTAPIELVMIPGNHDCDFSSGLESRDIVRGALPERLSVLKDGTDIVELMTIVQSSFFDFAQRAGAWTAASSRLYWEREFEIESDRIRLQCYNTAWTSSLHETHGSLLFPTAIADTHDAGARPVTVAISMLHHPLRWFEPTNSHALREHLDRTSDLVITGHEHIDHSYVVNDDAGSVVRYLEGAVLQEDGNSQSEFQLLVLDISLRRFKRLKFAWNDNKYERSSAEDWKGFQPNPNVASRGFAHSQRFIEHLEDCGVAFTHPRQQRLRLSDVFVYPDVIDRSSEEILTRKRPRRARISGRDFLDQLNSYDYVFVAGEAGCGKTSLAKRLVHEFTIGKIGVPLLLDGEALRDIDADVLGKACEAALVAQYSARQLETYRQLERRSRVIIIDNFQRTRLNKVGRTKVLEVLCRYAGLVIAFVDDLFLLEQLSGHSPRLVLADRKFALFEISEFGWRLRGELISKWHRLGAEFHENPDDVLHKIQQSEQLIAALIGKNLLPSHPLTVLTILQTHEAFAPQSSGALGGSFGYLYEHLITSSFSRISSRLIDIDTRYAYVSQIAYAMFMADADVLSVSDIDRLTREYSARVRMDLSADRELADLVTARILDVHDGRVFFKYKYVYCYFVARYFRDQRHSDSSIPTQLRRLIDRVHVEDYANIIAFYLFLSRDLQVVKDLLSLSREIFSNYEPSDLEVGFVKRLFKEFRPLAIPEADDTEARRRERREHLDETDEADAGLEEPRDVTYRHDLADILKLNFAFKTMQILGQVLRNFPGSLDGADKEEIATECYLLGLRTLSAFLALAETSFDEFREYLAKLLKEQRPMASRAELAVSADEVIISLTLACAHGILKRVGMAVGLEDLKRTYDDVMSRLGATLPVRVVDAGIKLDHFRHPPVAELERLAKDVRDRPFASALLRDMVANYLYVYRIEDPRTRQTLGAAFDIESTKPRFLENPAKKN
jgi:hypothetical protein